MRTNPYLAQHFGRLPAGSTAVGVHLSDDDDSSVDASEGFSHFKNPAHMQFSVFKPSKPAAKPQAEVPEVVVPMDTRALPLDGGEKSSPPGFQFVPGKRRGICIDNFPSKPTTPRSASLNGSALPPLMPTHVSPTPRSANANRDEGRPASTSSPSSSSSSAHSPHSPYAPRAPAPVTWNLAGSPISRTAPVQGFTVVAPGSTASTPPRTSTELTLAHPLKEDAATQFHMATVSDLIQRSSAALRVARAAMESDSGVHDSTTRSFPAVEVSPTTPGLSPPPSFPHSAAMSGLPHRPCEVPHSRSGPLDEVEDMETFSSDNVAFVSPTSGPADDSVRVFPRRGVPSQTTEFTSRSARDEPSEHEHNDAGSRCLHAVVLANTDAVVKRRLSRRPVSQRNGSVDERAVQTVRHDVLQPPARTSARQAEKDNHRVPSRPRVVTTAPSRPRTAEAEDTSSGVAPPFSANPEGSAMTLDSLNSMIEQLGRFLHHGGTPPPFGPKQAVLDACQEHSLVPPPRPERGRSKGRTTTVRAAPAPTVLVGRRLSSRARKPQVALWESGDASPMTAPHTATEIDSVLGAPSYAQPTQSWAFKSGALRTGDPHSRSVDPGDATSSFLA